MEIAVVVILLVAGLINGLPVIGVAGAGRLARLYGLPMADPDLLVLMRHRTPLLGGSEPAAGLSPLCHVSVSPLVHRASRVRAAREEK